MTVRPLSVSPPWAARRIWFATDAVPDSSMIFTDHPGVVIARNLVHDITYDPRGSAILNTLGFGQTTNDTFYYSVKDRYNVVVTAAIHIQVTGVNDVPTAIESGYAGFDAFDKDACLRQQGSSFGRKPAAMRRHHRRLLATLRRTRASCRHHSTPHCRVCIEMTDSASPRGGQPLTGLLPVLALLCISGIALRIPILAIPPLLPLIHDDLHMSEAQVGMLVGLPLALFALAAVPGSLLVARLGARVTLVGGLL